MQTEFDLVEDNIFARQLSENEYEFIQIIEMGSVGEEDRFLVIGCKTDFRWTTTEDLLKFSDGKLTEEQVRYPFAVCLFLFKDTELGNEDWNRVFKTMGRVKKFLLEEYSIDYDQLIEN